MLREITLGQYYPVDSFIHKLDPRVKLAGTFLFLISSVINLINVLIDTFANSYGVIVTIFPSRRTTIF